MKKIYVSFLVGCFICLGLFFLIADDKEYRFSNTNGDAVKTRWIYSILNKPDYDVDVAFIGASFIWQSIIPSVIEDKSNLKAVNFALPYAGRDLDYVIVKEVIASKHPKAIVLQLRYSEGRSSHKLFCELADVSDLFGQPLFPYLSSISNLSCFFRRSFSIFFQGLGNSETSYSAEIYDEYKGFKSIQSIAEPKILETQVGSYAKSYLPKKYSYIEYYYPNYYLNKIINLAKENNVKIYFLYLPDYKDNRKLEFNGLISSKEVIQLPREILDNSDFRSDISHFNNSGAKAVSEYLSYKIN